MGLDQYLTMKVNFYRSELLAENHDNYRREFEVADSVLAAMEYPREDVRNVEVIVTVLQWRKANAIHRWFVENVQDGVDDCGEYYVTEEQLEDLRNLCAQVLESVTMEPTQLVVSTLYSNEFPDGKEEYADGERIANPELAHELLPTQGGFFFGNTDYNEWYVQDLIDTRDGIDRVLKNLPDGAYLYYSSSW